MEEFSYEKKTGENANEEIESLSQQLSQDLGNSWNDSTKHEFPSLPRRRTPSPPQEFHHHHQSPRISAKIAPLPSRVDSKGRSKTQLWIANFDPTMTSEKLRQLAEQFGEVLGVQLHMKGQIPFGFVAYEREEDAQYATQALNEYVLEGHQLRVQAATRHSLTLDEQGAGKKKSSKASKIPMIGSWKTARVVQETKPLPPPSLPSSSSSSLFGGGVMELDLSTSKICIENADEITSLLRIDQLVKRRGRVIDRSFSDGRLLVEYEDTMQATEAADALDGFTLDGVELIVRQITESHSSSDFGARKSASRLVEKSGSSSSSWATIASSDNVNRMHERFYIVYLFSFRAFGL